MHQRAGQKKRGLEGPWFKKRQRSAETTQHFLPVLICWFQVAAVGQRNQAELWSLHRTRETRMELVICNIYMCNKGYILRIPKELLQINRKNNLIKQWTKGLNSYITEKKISRWLIIYKMALNVISDQGNTN